MRRTATTSRTPTTSWPASSTTGSAWTAPTRCWSTRTRRTKAARSRRTSSPRSGRTTRSRAPWTRRSTAARPTTTRCWTAFLEHADEEQTNPWPIVGWVVAGIAALVALVVGGRRLRRRRWRKAEDAQVADALRPSLQEEVVELSRTVAALPPAPAGARPRRRAQQPHPSGAGPGRGGPAPARRRPTAGPGWTRPTRSRTSYAGSRTRATSWSPSTRSATGGRCPRRPRRASSTRGTGRASTSGRSRRSSAWSARCPVCAKCAEEVDAGRKPAVRTFSLERGGQALLGVGPLHASLRQRLLAADTPSPTRACSGSRFAPSPAVSRPDKPAWSGIQFVWESDDGSGGSGSGGGGRRFSGSSGSRRSFGGGSSSRSSRRSGGSRRF